jgi:uncharacterized membrane protein
MEVRLVITLSVTYVLSFYTTSHVYDTCTNCIQYDCCYLRQHKLPHRLALIVGVFFPFLFVFFFCLFVC